MIGCTRIRKDLGQDSNLRRTHQFTAETSLQELLLSTVEMEPGMQEQRAKLKAKPAHLKPCKPD